MPLRRYVGDLHDNALERAQLARDLYARRHNVDLLHQSLQAEGAAAAYELVLRRLDADRAARWPRPSPPVAQPSL